MGVNVVESGGEGGEVEGGGAVPVWVAVWGAGEAVSGARVDVRRGWLTWVRGGWVVGDNDRGTGQGQGGNGLSFRLVEVVLVQDRGVREDVAQEPAQCRLATRGAATYADDGCFSVRVGGHRDGLVWEVGGCLVGVCEVGPGGAGLEGVWGSIESWFEIVLDGEVVR